MKPEPILTKQRDALEEVLAKKAELRVTILIDALRGSRETKGHNPASSVHLLVPLIKKFEDRVKVHLYHTPDLSGITKRVLPPRINEGE
jgi:CDP-diacylglycerol--glycerol-3-phosphate 3-phosphatidyltransferase